MSIAIICTVGIPGSGKSHFCCNTANNWKWNSMMAMLPEGETTSVRYVQVSFDDIQRLSPTQYHTTVELPQNEAPLTPYKVFRRGMVRLVEAIVLYLKAPGPLVLPELVNTPGVLEYISGKMSDIPTGQPTCLLVDDNMYYRSMRHPYYQIARKYGAGYGQIYFNTPLDMCLARNSLRHGDERMDEHVIVGMSERLEEPDPAGTPWEARSMVLAPTAVPHDIQSFITSCLANPVEVLHSTNENSRMASAQITAEDLLHQSDLMLRQLVKLSITTARTAGSAAELKERARRANVCRKSLLSYIKSHSSELSDLLTSAGQHAGQYDSRDTQSTLYQFLDTMFREHLSTVSL